MTLERIQRIVNGFAVVAVCLAIGLMVWQLVLLNQTRDAVCALRADLETRTEQSEAFLKNTPADQPLKFGSLTFPRSQLVSNIANQRRTIAVLEVVDCNERLPFGL